MMLQPLLQGESENLGSQVFKPFFKPRMPNRETMKGILSYDKPDLEEVGSRYLAWVNYSEYLVFRRENIHTGDRDYLAVKMSKRGNDVYHRRVRRSLADLEDLPNVQFFNWKDRSKRHRTRALFITLKIDSNLHRLDEAWEGIAECPSCGDRRPIGDFTSEKVVNVKGTTYYRRVCCGVRVREVGGFNYYFNRFKANLRKKYGSFDMFRVWEAHESGYPHGHAIVVFHDKEFDAFSYQGIWRVQEKREIEEAWQAGHSDVEALASTRGGIYYVAKYLGKLHRVGVTAQDSDPNAGDGLTALVSKTSTRTLGLMWIFRKRSFSLSQGFRSAIDDIRTLHNQNRTRLGQVDLAGDPIYSWTLIGYWGGDYGTWTKRLKISELFRLKADPSWSDAPGFGDR